MTRLAGKRVLMVIASQEFRDEEYQVPRAILEREGARVSVASSTLAPSTGMLGAVVEPDLLLKNAKEADYDAIVFVGGGGAKEYWDDATAHALARDFHAAGKTTSAICIAPVTLARAGLLKGKAATCWPETVKHLKSAGALTKAEGCVADGHLVTADGPGSAEAFGRALVTSLAGGR